jgi:hypothetical protein
VGSTPTRATDKCVGWALASLSGCNPPAFTLCRFNSCPTHWTARSSIGMRTPASQAGEMGSIPIRATRPSGGTGRHATFRPSCHQRHGSSTLPLVTAEWTGAWFQHGLISRSTPVQIRPPQLLAEYANLVKRPGRELGESLWVRFPPRLLKTIPWSSGEDSWPTSRQRWFESIRDHWSAGVVAACLRGKEGGRVQVPGGPLKKNGLLVQREDTWFAPRESGFNSPAVHCKWGSWSKGKASGASAGGRCQR